MVVDGHFSPLFLNIHPTVTQIGTPGKITTTLTASETAAIAVGRSAIAILITDSLGAQLVSPSVNVGIVAASKQGDFSLELQRNSAPVSLGPYAIDFVGPGFSSVTSSLGKTTVSIAAGAGGVQSVTASAPIVSGGGLNPIISHAISGVTAGAYDRMTVDAAGHVTTSAQDYSTIFTKAVTTLVNYFTADWAAYAGQEVVRLTGAGGGTSGIMAFPAPAAGKTKPVMFINASTTTLNVTSQNASESVAANRWVLPANFSMAPDHCFLAWYDFTTARWRIAGAY